MVFDKLEFIEQAKREGKRCSLVLLTFNRWFFTDLTLKSVLKNTHFPHDLIVVDNGSTDGTVEELKKLYDVGKIDVLILLPKNTGSYGGMNIGVKIHDENEWFQHLANDVQVCPYWLTYLCYITSHPEIGIACPNWAPKHYGKFYTPDMQRDINGIPVAFANLNISGINFHRRVLKKIGYLRDDYSIYGTGDFEFDRRAKLNGFRPCYVLGMTECKLLLEVLPPEVYKKVEAGFCVDGLTYRQWKNKMHKEAEKKVASIMAKQTGYYDTSYTKKWISQYVYRAKKKVLVIGGSGFLGKKLRKFLSDEKDFKIFWTYHSNDDGGIKLNVSDPTAITEALARTKPDIIIHLAALTNIDTCEREKELARKINTECLNPIVKYCKENNKKLVFISSSAVFDGNNPPYKIDSVREPLSFYGVTKTIAENIIRNNLKDYVIIRTEILYGYNDDGDKETFPVLVKEILGKNEVLDVDDRRKIYPTLIDDLSKKIKTLIKEGKSGIFQIASKKQLTHYSFALEIAEVFNLNKKLIKKQNRTYFKRPMDARMILTIEAIPVRKGLALMKEQKQ